MNKFDVEHIWNSARSRRTFLKFCAVSGLAMSNSRALNAIALEVQLNANEVKKSMLVIDALGGISNVNLSEEELDGPSKGIDVRALTDAAESGLCAFNQTLGFVFGKQDPYEFTLNEIKIWDALINRHGASLLKVQTVNDIQLAKERGKIGVIYGFQNCAMMGSDAGRVATFSKLGVRVMQLTYNGRNQIGDGAMEMENLGLTKFGHEIVHELNRNRVLVDLSHSGENTCLEAIRSSSHPIMISHTGCKAVADLPRNKSDNELKLVADRGGYVGIYFMPFLAKGRQPMAADLIAHLEHAINICGEDHVGIGTDGDVPKIDDMPAYMQKLQIENQQRRAAGISAPGESPNVVTFLPDLCGPDKFHKLADLLAQRGHSSRRIEKIMGINFLRVAEMVWS